jgi:hypothetical protein
MTRILSDWAREFLREDRVAVISTLNKDCSQQVRRSGICSRRMALLS